MLSNKAKEVIGRPKKSNKKQGKLEIGVDLATGKDESVTSIITPAGKMITLPIDHLSQSALLQLLRNPLIFKMKYVLKIYTSNTGVSGIVGRACHEALKFYYGGNPDVVVPVDPDEARGEATAFGLDYIDKYPDGGIEYGKNGTREDMLQRYTKMMDNYWAEEPHYHKVIMSEKKLKQEIHTMDGQLLPLPAVTIPDLVVENPDETWDIVDTKFVSSFTSSESEDYEKIIQAMFLFHVVKEETGRYAQKVIFREVKGPTNKKCENPTTCGEEHDSQFRHSQIKDYVVPCDHQPYHMIFYNLYRDAVKFLSSPDAIYLPNLSDMFDGEQAGLIYAQGLLSSDMSDVEVMHKVRDVALVTKKFITPRVESVENKNLLPEEKIKMKLAEFGIPVEPVETVVGASVTQYRFKVSSGVRMTTFAKHKADIAKVLEAKADIRILAPIPGTSLIGIEMGNEVRIAVKLTKEHLVIGTLTIPVGVDVNGKAMQVLLSEMPHLLIAGATGSGKSVIIHAIITALIKQMTHDDMQLVLIDPKRVELVAFANVKHLKGRKIIYEYDDGVRALLNLTDVMEERYQLLEKSACRNIDEYHKKGKKMPYIVVVIDEFADFMLRSKIEEKENKQKSYGSRSIDWLISEHKKREIEIPDKGDVTRTEAKQILTESLEAYDSKDEMKRADANVEILIVRLAQMARAVGIHLIIATQRPSVDVITGLIKANMPTRIALTTSSPVDSQVILGEPGAEKLTGKGDMIFMHPSQGKVRLQGFLAD